MNVSMIVVTRGDVDITPIRDSRPLGWEFVEWNNATAGQDLSVYGRYAAIEHARGDVIMVQDDDAILAPESFDALLAAWKPGHVVCNMPERFRPNYPDSALVGFGAIFERDLPAQAFERFCAHFYPNFLYGGHWSPLRVAKSGIVSLDFARECDAIFTGLTPRILVDALHVDREFASDPTRLWKQPEHVGARARMLALARQVRDAVPA